MCAGSDEERSAIPIGSSMHNNIIMSRTNLDPFTVYDDISGISFEGNVLNEEADVPIDGGFSKAPYSVAENEHGLLVPAQSLIDEIGFIEDAIDRTVELAGLDKKKTRVVTYTQPVSLADVLTFAKAREPDMISQLAQVSSAKAWYLSTPVLPTVLGATKD